jgi:hypothetical protein
VGVGESELGADFGSLVLPLFIPGKEAGKTANHLELRIVDQIRGYAPLRMSPPLTGWQHERNFEAASARKRAEPVVELQAGARRLKETSNSPR